MTASFMSDFRSLSINFSTIFDSWVFHISRPRFGHYAQKNTSPKFSALGIVTERGLREC